MNDRIPSAAIGNLIEEMNRLTLAISRLAAVIESQSDGSAGGGGASPNYRVIVNDPDNWVSPA